MRRLLPVLLTTVIAACAAPSAPEPATAPTASAAAPPRAKTPPPAPAASTPAVASAAVPARSADPSAPAVPTPLSAELRQALDRIRADPPPRAITRERHYLVSNENQHHLYHRVVASRGGIQIGVGAEQNYLLAGWARPEILILMDYDEWVAELNRVYGLLFERAATPEEFLELWAFKRSAEVVRWIRERWPEQRDHWKKVRSFQHGYANVHHRLERLARRHRQLGVPSFIDDAEQYDYVAGLWRTGRVLSVRGDLVQDRTMADIAAFARASDVAVRLVYLSNAEDYFRYARGRFRQNLSDLPYDERSLILHTKPYDRDFYRYVYQSGPNFRAWLASDRVETWCDLFAFTEPAGSGEAQRDLLRITALPDTAPAPPRAPCSQPDGS